MIASSSRVTSAALTSRRSAPAIHAWDVAVALGRPSPLTDEVAAALAPTAHEIVEPLRNYGVYAPALADDSSDGAAAALLRYLGRDPRWTR